MFEQRTGALTENPRTTNTAPGGRPARTPSLRRPQISRPPQPTVRRVPKTVTRSAASYQRKPAAAAFELARTRRRSARRFNHGPGALAANDVTQAAPRAHHKMTRCINTSALTALLLGIEPAVLAGPDRHPESRKDEEPRSGPRLSPRQQRAQSGPPGTAPGPCELQAPSTLKGKSRGQPRARC
jgi:hypothetical protein